MPLRVLTTESKITDSAEARRWVEQNVARGCTKVHDHPLFWLDIIEPDPEAIDWLAGFFHFHPLTIEDLRSPNERGKIEIYEGYVFVIAHAVSIEGSDQLSSPHHAPGQHAGHAGTPEPRRILQATPRSDPAGSLICDIESYELHAYLSRNYLITVRDPELKLVDKIWNEIDNHQDDEDPHPLEHGPDYLLYRILDDTADTYFEALEHTADQIDYLEDTVIDRPDRDLLNDVFVVKRNLVTIRRQATPVREGLNVLSNPGAPVVRPENQIYLRDVHNLMITVYELADTQRDSTGGVLDAYLSSVNNNLSTVMKRLTIISTIFLPISFIVGFGGMNFVNFIPYDNPIMFWGLVASLVIVPIVMLLWFYRSRWI